MNIYFTVKLWAEYIIPYAVSAVFIIGIIVYEVLNYIKDKKRHKNLDRNCKNRRGKNND